MEQPHYFRPVLARIEFHHASQREANQAVKEQTAALAARRFLGVKFAFPIIEPRLQGPSILSSTPTENAPKM